MTKSQWKLLAKSFFSLVLIAYFLNHFQVEEVAQQLVVVSFPVTICAVLLTMAMSLPHALRWELVIKANSGHLGYMQALKLAQVGYFFNQALPSSVGGDLVRVWHAHRHGLRLSMSFNSVVVDRLAALAGLLLMVGILQPWLFDIVINPYLRGSLVSLLVGGGVFFVALLTVDRLPEKYFVWRPLKALWHMSGFTRNVFLDGRYALIVLMLSVLIHVLVCLVVFILAKGMGVPIALTHCLMMVPLVMLVTMVPLSIAGWGVREGAMVIAFGMVGIPASNAFSLSLLFGLVVLVASLPGALIWLFNMNHAKGLTDVSA